MDNSSMLSNALGSAVAGIIARVFTHPLDTAKARLQAVYNTTNLPARTPAPSRNPYSGPLDVLINTARTEGVAGLYRGFGAVIIGGTPGTMIYLCSYEIVKERLSRNSQSSGEDFIVHFSCGMIAETLACLVYVPVDVVKERMQVQHSSSGDAAAGRKETATAGGPNYRGSWDGFKQILRNEGLSGIYRGYGATLASFGPFSALYFVFYERFKFWARGHLTGRTAEQSSRDLENVNLPFRWIVLCSSGAGALASWMTSPLDMAKLRLQVQRGKLANNPTAAAPTAVTYRGVIDCLRHSYLEGGARALFRGAGARVIHFVPATTITMTCYETCRSFFAGIL